MANKKVSRRALFTSIMSLILCCALLVGTTFAWFTDSVSTVNTIQSGNLDIELEYKLHDSEADWAPVTTATELFNKDALWEPGHAEVVYLRISNKGSLALKYQLGLNVVTENTSTNAAGENFALSNYIMFDVLDGATKFATREAAIDAATNAKTIYSTYEHPYYDTYGQEGRNVMEKGAPTQELTLVVYMPETVGNEANFKTGATVPTIQLGVNLTATQLVSESDSFGSDYDTEASLPQSGVGSAQKPAEGVSAVEITVRNAATNAKIATVTVPAAAIADNAEAIDVNVVPTALDSNFTAVTDKVAQTYDISVDGLCEGNTTAVKVQLRIPAGLDPDTVKLYHYNEPIGSTYNPATGYVTFETATFSPFTVVYDAESVAPSDPGTDNTDPDVVPEGMPKANVTNVSGEKANQTLEWKSFGSIGVADSAQMLDVVYKYESSDEAYDSKYDSWYCDFYVSVNKSIEEGQLFLGGEYGEFGWVGFDAPAVEANTEYALLASAGAGGLVTHGEGSDTGWTYSDIKTFVGTFHCGVAKSVHYEGDLSDLTFTVNLCLTNPANPNEYYNVNTTTYTFN